MTKSSDTVAETLDRVATALADAIPAVDETAEHDRWKSGIGPFEEEIQIRKILAKSDLSGVETEVEYPDSGQRCDLVVESGDARVPIEAKLLRFRYDNGRVNPNAYGRVFSPVPEGSSLLTDAEKLRDSAFGMDAGLLGLFYKQEDEPLDAIDPERMAEKFVRDINYWYDFAVETQKIARFDGLRHPVHQQGAVITWKFRR